MTMSDPQKEALLSDKNLGNIAGPSKRTRSKKHNSNQSLSDTELLSSSLCKDQNQKTTKPAKKGKSSKNYQPKPAPQLPGNISILSRNNGQNYDSSSSSSSSSSSESSTGDDSASSSSDFDRSDPIRPKRLSKKKEKPQCFLEQKTKILSSNDKSALRKLKNEILGLPKALAEVRRKGGNSLKNYRETVKDLVYQVNTIRRDLKEGSNGRLSEPEKVVRANLKEVVEWVNETFLEHLHSGNDEDGLLDSIRTELAEELPGEILGQAETRLLRSKIKSFMNRNKKMKSVSASTLFNWSTQKRGFGGKRHDSRRNDGQDSHRNKRSRR